ncbi:hypothetical protein C2L66_15900 [Paraburkholderia caribensis]|nr:hypothetical protein C2L66_15900 [Paraburkholderia caribensis]
MSTDALNEPHTPVDVEGCWRDFVRTVGGEVVEDLIPQPRTFENADFLFSSDDVVVELKEVQTEFWNTSAIRNGFEALLARLAKEDPAWRPALLGGSGEYPNWFRTEFIRLFRPPISRILKKANRQIRETKGHFKISAAKGVLVLVNDGFTSLEPHYVRALASNLLGTSYTSIDCFLYLTVNRYVEIADSDIAGLLWMPTYSDRASDSLVSFIDDLGPKWFNFLEQRVGPFSAPLTKISQDDGFAPRMRAIVLPNTT